MARMGMATRIIGVALGLALALTALASATAQQEPPYRFYGTGATAGDEIVAMDASGDELGMATVDADGAWYIDVPVDKSEGVMFTLNGEKASANVTETGSGQAMVTLTVAMSDDHGEDSMSEDSMMGDDDAMDGHGEDSMMDDHGEDSMSGDSMMDDEDSMMDGHGGDSMMDGHGDGMHGYPNSGSGGLADGGVPAGLIGLLVALGAVSIAGLGLRRARNRS